MKLRCNILALFFLFLFPVFSFAQPHHNHGKKAKPEHHSIHKLKVYIDCNSCYVGYIKSHIHFINYVRDNTAADIYLLIRRVGTASGGHDYTLKFIGRHRYSGKRDTLQYISNSTATQDIERRGLIKRIKIGLIPFILNTKIAKYLNVDYTRNGNSEEESQVFNDPWNHWVFHIDAGTYISGQKTHKHLSLNGALSAERVTNNWKMTFHTNGHFNRDIYLFSDSTRSRATQNSENYYGLIAKSMNPHWSLGVYSNANSSTYNNIDISFGASPAIEYNIFPYSQYSQHQLSFRYQIIPYYNKYSQETIFLKTQQFVVKQQLSVHLALIQPWGEINSRITGSHILNDFKKNRLNFHVSLDVKLFRGLSLHLWGQYSLINDQISLANQNVSNQDVLLNLRQQATSYSFSTSVGLRYTFGSIYNNVVNTRF